MTGQNSNLAYKTEETHAAYTGEIAWDAFMQKRTRRAIVHHVQGPVAGTSQVDLERVQPSFGERISHWFKRLFDILASSALLVMLSPVFAFVAARIMLHDGRPVFFGSGRIGRNGQVFKAWKFRSMVKDAEAVLAAALEGDEGLRKEWFSGFKLKNDPRITPFGDMLRRTSLDELPQLWNVLRGDMSLVGPRPLLLDEPQSYGASFETYKLVRPGITGVWQVAGRSDLPYQKRAQCNDWYIGNRSTYVDLAILWRTALVVARRVGAR